MGRLAPAPTPALPLRGLLRASRADLLLAAGLLAWVPLVLLLDRGAGIWEQRALGLGTWAILLALLARESRLTRVQVAVVVVFATVIEYTFSPLLHVYVYRLHNVPAFVPPGHGMVYLCALAIGRAPVTRAYRRPLVAATVALCGAYALWGVTLSPRTDVLGLFWFLCLLGFLRWGPSSTLYVGAFVAVTYLELFGTAVGTWRWSELDPTGIVPIGNPPSGAAGGYGWFDLAAVLAAPALLAAWDRTRARATAGPPAGRSVPGRSVAGERGERGLVQEPVGGEGAAA